MVLFLYFGLNDNATTFVWASLKHLYTLDKYLLIFVVSSISEILSFEHLRVKDKYFQRLRPWDERFIYASQLTATVNLPRKEVIQPHLPVRLPCYDFTPVTNPALGRCFLTVSSRTSGVVDFHGVTGGVYKTRERIQRSVLICVY